MEQASARGYQNQLESYGQNTSALKDRFSNLGASVNASKLQGIFEKNFNLQGKNREKATAITSAVTAAFQVPAGIQLGKQAVAKISARYGSKAGADVATSATDDVSSRLSASLGGSTPSAPEHSVSGAEEGRVQGDEGASLNPEGTELQPMGETPGAETDLNRAKFSADTWGEQGEGATFDTPAPVDGANVGGATMDGDTAIAKGLGRVGTRVAGMTGEIGEAVGSAGRAVGSGIAEGLSAFGEFAGPVGILAGIIGAITEVVEVATEKPPDAGKTMAVRAGVGGGRKSQTLAPSLDSSAQVSGGQGAF